MFVTSEIVNHGFAQKVKAQRSCSDRLSVKRSQTPS
jgi:hypothetical protein